MTITKYAGEVLERAGEIDLQCHLSLRLEEGVHIERD